MDIVLKIIAQKINDSAEIQYAEISTAKEGSQILRIIKQ